jgi:hypothetical protein
VQRLDDPLRFSRVSNRPAGLLDAGLQRRLADKLLRPKVLKKIVLGDNAIALGDEVAQDVEHLRTDRDTSAGPVQFSAVRVERIITKEILHGA